MVQLQICIRNNKYGLQYNDYILGKGIKNENAYRISEIFDWEKMIM